MLIDKLKILENNPRYIKENQFNKLKKSLKEFLEMLEVRQIVYDDDFVIWGGNQRFRAYKMLVEQGEVEYNEKYFKKLPSNWTLEKKQEFAIKDNNPQGLSGNFDDDILANEWSDLPLDDWGIFVPEWVGINHIEGDVTEREVDEFNKNNDYETNTTNTVVLIYGDKDYIYFMEKVANLLDKYNVKNTSELLLEILKNEDS